MLRTNDSLIALIQIRYDQQKIKEHITLKRFQKGDKLFVQNTFPSKVMLVKDGITKCFLNENNDKEFILEFLGKGEIIGEIEFIRKTPCLCHVEAVTDVEVFALTTAYFGKLLRNDSYFNQLIINSFADRITNTATRAVYQQLYTLENSLKRLLELNAKQELSLSKEDMAAYLGISVRSLNRVLKGLQE